MVLPWVSSLPLFLFLNLSARILLKIGSWIPASFIPSRKSLEGYKKEEGLAPVPTLPLAAGTLKPRQKDHVDPQQTDIAATESLPENRERLRSAARSPIIGSG